MTRRRLSGMDLAILRLIADHPCHGLGYMSDCIEAGRRSYVRERIERLQSAGLLSMDIPPMFGRGHRIIIRKAGR